MAQSPDSPLILHVCAYYAPAFVYGGPPRTVHGLCGALRRGGADLQVFTTDANGAGALPRSVTSVSSYESVPVRYFPRSWPLQPIGSRALALALRETLTRVDVLHIHGLWNRVVWAAAREARLAGVPYVLSPRGMLEDAAFEHHSWRKRAAYALLERRTIQDAARLHATSAREVASIREWLPSARIVCIPNGVDGPHAAREGQRGAAATEGPSLLFVGRLHPLKRLDLLIDAFVRVRAQHPGARLVIAGPDESGMQPALAARAGSAAGAIDWAGAVDADERDRLMARSSALILCSDSESFGMSVLEAMAVGLPVVVTDTCGWTDVGAQGAGLVVPQDAGAIAEAACRIIECPEDSDRMGHRGAALAAARYGWEAVARQFMRLYAEVAWNRAALAAATS